MKPIYKGNLLRLAAPQADDRDLLAQWTNDDNYMRLLDDDPVRPLPPDSFTFSESNDSYYFHLRTLEADQFIGFVVLFNIKWRNQTAELAIGIGDAEFRGKGYGSDALKLILNYGWSELNLHHIGLNVLENNAAAIKAYERVGFVLEGTRRGVSIREGKRYDLLLYGILRDEFKP